MKNPYLLLVPLFFSLAWPAAGVLAKDGQSEARRLQAAGQILPLEKIIRSAQTVKAGEVLEVEFDHNDGRYIYEVEIVDAQGQVWEMDLDARNGKLIVLEKED